MYFPIQKTLEKYLNIGFAKGDTGNDLNQKHVVNFSYLLFFASCLVLLLFFSFISQPILAVFCFIWMLMGGVAWRYCYKGEFTRAQITFPILKSSKVLILCLFFFGEETGFHWLFANIIVYAVVVFRGDQKVIKYGILFSSSLGFLVCEFFSQSSLALTEVGKSLCIFFVFFKLTFHFTTVITLVMSRLNAVNLYLRNLAEKDELTGLYNRRKVLAEAQNIFEASVLNSTPCIFAIIDLDYFKKVNDTYGHDAGDLVLAKAASIMKSALRPQDLIGRYGGEEFIVIMRNIHIEQSVILMNKMRESIKNSQISLRDDTEISISLSIGLASMDSSTSRYEEVLVKADKALYLAKHNGRNCVYTEMDSLL
ncbi:GGDEF domain-containing protein [Marinomonas sp. C2222]|uniref:diguanylate cyclase n=1 Tax=Marinomonas sargassi TaxID=2984494 RepID=A0ABT2YS08_9GAMM|nr:GGDEF domain-containing protein [Marinomonas sargassi]MCV2402683.1 GGDEF domain-containing protein [Marinomonas sargassi]